MADHRACFKAYDIRGRVPDELDAELAYNIGQAYSAYFKPQRMAIGHDIRQSGPSLSQALADGFLDAGVAVVDLGLCGTEEIYFASFDLDVDGGIVVTASHNPADYNGMKLVRKGAVPVSGDTGLDDIKMLAVAGQRVKALARGNYEHYEDKAPYIDHLLGYINRQESKPLRLVVNAGNGCAGPIVNLLQKYLPFEFIKIQFEPDGTFPNGVPNPLLPENREITSRAVVSHGADLGIAWDGDFDRCFFFDETGAFVEGYYIVGLLARAMLAKAPGAKIIHDPRLTWNTVEVVTQQGGRAVMSKTGHAFIKERMRAEDALYGGEMSAHHYFRDFSYCDSGMIPWLLVTELLSSSDSTFSAMIRDRQAAYPVSGEINRKVQDPDAVIALVERRFSRECPDRDFTDGLSMGCHSFRFNVRKSNTEPLLRLNVETRGDGALLQQKTKELLDIIENS